jgi:hypothetical protein
MQNYGFETAGTVWCSQKRKGCLQSAMFAGACFAMVHELGSHLGVAPFSLVFVEFIDIFEAPAAIAVPCRCILDGSTCFHLPLLDFPDSLPWTFS